MPSDDDARRAHYADLFEPRAAEGPIGVVLGNCQAESLRQALAGTDVRFLRVPPVHELTADDVPHLERLLADVDIVIAQPVRDDYHGLPLGTRQVLAAAPRARTAIMPVIRFAGLYPWQAIIRPPEDPSATPPVVAYHDLRTLAEAAGGTPAAAPSVSALRSVAAASLAELRRREQRHGAVPVSDVLASVSFDHMRTINHPGNPVWHALAARVHDALALTGVPQRLERPLLDAVHAPREAIVIEAHELDADPRDHWIVAGEALDPLAVRAAHLGWYREHPDAVRAGVERHAGTMAVLGL